MDAQLSTHPLVRTLLVAVPGMLIALFLGVLLGEGNSTFGLILLFTSVGLLVAGALSRRGYLESAIVGFLVIGYMVGNRGFAQLYVVQPVFVGEMCMLICGALVAGRILIRHDKLNLRDPLVIAVTIYLGYAAIRFLFDVRQYKIDAIRDFAVVYYSAFFFIAYQLGSKPGSRAFLERAFIVAVALHAVVATIFHINPDLLARHFVVRSAPLFIQKGDLTMTFSAVGMFFLLNRRRVFGLVSLRNLLLVVLAASATLGIARAALLGVAVASVLLWIAGERRAFLYPLLALVLVVVAMLTITATGSSVRKVDQVVAFKEKLASIFDVSGKYRYETELGMMKSDNNEFRRTFWRIIVKETTKSNPVVGKGFGYDFYPQFEAYYNRGWWEGLRSPHNYFVTVYGRMGIVGLLLFSGVTFLIVQRAIRAARMVRQGRMHSHDFSFWCGTLILLISGTFGVVLEGPMGAIPFWTCLGLALSSPVREQALPAPVRPRPAYAGEFPRIGARSVVPAGARR